MLCSQHIAASSCLSKAFTIENQPVTTSGLVEDLHCNQSSRLSTQTETHILSTCYNALSAWRNDACSVSVWDGVARLLIGSHALMSDTMYAFSTIVAGSKCQQQDDLVVRVLLSANLSSPYAQELLRPFHSTCSAGRDTSLRTITHLHLERCLEHGVSSSRQLTILAAADQATALTIDASQMQGLLDALVEQQQQEEEEEQQQEMAMEEEEDPQQLQVAQLGGALQGASLGDAVRSSSNHATTTTSSSSRGKARAADTKPRGPQLTHITVGSSPWPLPSCWSSCWMCSPAPSTCSRSH
jgi:hypothetical protein